MPTLSIYPTDSGTDRHHYLERESDRDRAPSNRAFVPITPSMLAWLDATGAEIGRRMVAADERLRRSREARS